MTKLGGAIDVPTVMLEVDSGNGPLERQIDSRWSLLGGAMPPFSETQFLSTAVAERVAQKECVTRRGLAEVSRENVFSQKVWTEMPTNTEV